MLQDDSKRNRNDVYYEQLEEYEETRLRDDPCRRWGACVLSGSACMRRVSGSAISRMWLSIFGTGIMGKAIEEWVCAFKAGESPRGIRDGEQEMKDEEQGASVSFDIFHCIGWNWRSGFQCWPLALYSAAVDRSVWYVQNE
jgi:hypothetical protein